MPEVRFGKYLLHERLGAGGMAEVWAATLPGASGIDKRCVIKRILPRYLADERFVRMFLAEARLSIALQHGNIVPVLDFGEVEGTHYLAMEWIDGRDLGLILERARHTGVAFPIPLALHVVHELCRGLAYVHAKEGPDGLPLRLVHRDVSPSNVLVSWEGDVKLADFGIAKVLTSLGETREHEIKGKASYMSPEQARGEPIDARADVYAAALVLWELCTGKRPVETRSAREALARRREADPIPFASSLRPDLPGALDAVLARALAPRASERTAEIKELLGDVAQLLARLAPGTTASDLGAFVRRLFAPAGTGDELTRARTTPLRRAPDDGVDPVTGEAATLEHAAFATTAPLEPDTRPAVDLPVEPTTGVAPRALSAEAATGTAPLPVPAEAITATAPLPLARHTVRLARPRRWAPWLGLGAIALAAAVSAALVLGGAPLAPDRAPGAGAMPRVLARPDAPAPAAPGSAAGPAPALGETVAAPPAELSEVAPPAALPSDAPPPSPAAGPAEVRGDEPSGSAGPVQGRRVRSTAGEGAARERGVGRLEVSARPWAEVIVDGRRRAESTPAVISLPAGWHTVRLVNPEAGLRHTERVRIEAGETTRLARRLR